MISQKGLSLIEVIVTLLVTLILGATMVPLLQVGVTSFVELYPNSQAVLEGETALNKITYDLTAITLPNAQAIVSNSGSSGNRPDTLAFNNSANAVITILGAGTPPTINFATTYPATTSTMGSACFSSGSSGSMIFYQQYLTTLVRSLFTYTTSCTSSFTGATATSVSNVALAQNISNLTFTYFDATGASIASLSSGNLASIRYITAQFTSNGHTFKQTVFLRNSL